MTPSSNRESWLNALIYYLKPWFAAAGTPIAAPVRVAIGFPSTGSRGRRIGECWDITASADHTHEILIRPDLADPAEVAAVLVHELCHVAAGIPAGHGPAFRTVATALGLTGKMTATTAGDALTLRLAPILAQLGPLPHASLGLGNSTGPKKQSARLLKASCSACGYTVRVTRKWAEVGAPHCPHHGAMVVEWPDDELTDEDRVEDV